MVVSGESKGVSPGTGAVAGLDASSIGSSGLGGEDATRATFSVVLIDSNAFSRECTVGALETTYGCASILGCGSVADLPRHDLRTGAVQIALLNAHGKRASDSSIRTALAELRDRLGPVAIVLIADQDSGDRVIEALSHGIRGYIPATATLKVAVEAMRLVEAGGTYIPADSLRNYSLSRASNGSGLNGHQFTPRQMSVLQRIQQGRANKVIAHELSMSESTVKVHIRNIMHKLKATNRTEVAFRTQNLFNPED